MAYQSYSSAPVMAGAMGAYPGMPGAGAGAAVEQPKRPHLYVGNLSPRVTDYMLGEIFAVAGPVVSAKIVQDRNFSHGGFNYGFVEYSNMGSAEHALTTLNGRKIFDAEIRVNWAYQGQQTREDTQHHFHVFVGDLSPEVNDEVLKQAFGAFGSLSEARVMWDMNSGKSRGYGFLSFRDKADAEQAINSMNGQFLGNRAIRVNWANQKTQTGTGTGRTGPPPLPGSMGSPMGGAHMGSPMTMHQAPMGGAYGAMASAPTPQNFGASALSYESVAAQTPDFNTTVYVGNLIPYTQQADLIPIFQGYGYIVEIRMQADRGFAFVKLDTHHNAALAITQLQNRLIHGRPIKCSWGKDKAPSEGGAPIPVPAAGASPAGAGAAAGAGAGAGAYQQYPGYNYYGGGYGYAQTGVPGQPGQPTVDPSAQAAGGGQWDAAAAAAYYQQSGGWGNYYAQDSQSGQATNGSS